MLAHASTARRDAIMAAGCVALVANLLSHESSALRQNATKMLQSCFPCRKLVLPTAAFHNLYQRHYCYSTAQVKVK